METFLDRLMMAELGGRDTLRNSRSTAVGPFQLIEPTFLEVVRKHFAAETASLTLPQMLALRTDRSFSRRVAETYTKQNAALLAKAGVAPTFPHLRLAYLVGPSAALRVVRMPANTPAALVLGPAAIKANPFLARMTVSDLIAKAARDLAVHPATTAGVVPPPSQKSSAQAQTGAPAIPVRCNLQLATCRRWLELAKHRVAEGQPVTSKLAARQRRTAR